MERTCRDDCQCHNGEFPASRVRQWRPYPHSNATGGPVCKHVASPQLLILCDKIFLCFDSWIDSGDCQLRLMNSLFLLFPRPKTLLIYIAKIWRTKCGTTMVWVKYPGCIDRYFIFLYREIPVKRELIKLVYKREKQWTYRALRYTWFKQIFYCAIYINEYTRRPYR